MIVHPALWDILLLKGILTECSPAEQDTVMVRLIGLICDASDAKARLGLDWRYDSIRAWGSDTRWWVPGRIWCDSIRNRN